MIFQGSQTLDLVKSERSRNQQITSFWEKDMNIA